MCIHRHKPSSLCAELKHGPVVYLLNPSLRAHRLPVFCLVLFVQQYRSIPTQMRNQTLCEALPPESAKHICSSMVQMMATDTFRIGDKVGDDLWLLVKNGYHLLNSKKKPCSFPSLLFPIPEFPPEFRNPGLISFLFTGICFPIYIIDFLAELWALHYDLHPAVPLQADHKYKITDNV